jgi:hypothetical protein
MRDASQVWNRMSHLRWRARIFAAISRKVPFNKGELFCFAFTVVQSALNLEYQEKYNSVDSKKVKPGGLDLSRRGLDRDLDLDAQKISVSTVEKISTVFKS